MTSAQTVEITFFAGEWGDARVDRARALELLQCDEDRLDEEIAAGLPQWTEGGEPVLGYCDVMNAGLYRGHRLSIARLAERYIVGFAAQPAEAWVREERWALMLSDACPEGCASEATPGLPETHAAGTSGWRREAAAGGVTWTLETAACGTVAEVEDARLRELYWDTLEELRGGRLRYHYLPRELRAAPEAARELGVCDCMTIARALERACGELGVPSRLRLGYLLGMMPIEHAWVEALDRGEYKPLDPVLAALVSRSASEDARARIGEFCLGSLPTCVLRWPPGAASPLVPAGCSHALAVRSAMARPVATTRPASEAGGSESRC